MSFFRDIRYELKWMCEEIAILTKHPTRKASWKDLKHHWLKLWDYIIFHPWYCLKRGTRNLMIWFPIIWRNDCWDYFFLCDMMDKQLKEMEDFWTNEAQKERTSDWNMERGFRCQHRRIWKRIRWTRKLMTMWRDEYYSCLAYDEHHEAFPERDNLLDSSTVAKVDEFGIPVLFTCKPMSEDARADYRTRSDIAHKKDLKLLKLWQKNLGFIQRWWY